MKACAIFLVFAAAAFMTATTPKLEPEAPVADSPKLDAQRQKKDGGLRAPSPVTQKFYCDREGGQEGPKTGKKAPLS